MFLIVTQFEGYAKQTQEFSAHFSLAVGSTQLKHKMRAISHLVCTMPFSECSAPVPQYVNRGLLNFGANGWQRGWGGCGCTLNGKPALLCAVVMAGDYLTKQKDWMNAPPQIGRAPSLFPTIASLPFLTFIIYVRPGSDLNALIMVPLRLGDIWQLDRVLVWLCILFIFFTYTPCYLL